MTSKAAFILLVNSYLGDNNSRKEVDKNYAEVVNKLMGDLDVLEILKEHIVIDCVGNVLIRSISKENEQKILKEWFENNKQKVTSSTDINQEIYITEENGYMKTHFNRRS